MHVKLAAQKALVLEFHHFKLGHQHPGDTEYDSCMNIRGHFGGFSRTYNIEPRYRRTTMGDQGEETQHHAKQ